MSRHLKKHINYVAINGATLAIATTMATNTTKGATYNVKIIILSIQLRSGYVLCFAL